MENEQTIKTKPKKKRKIALLIISLIPIISSILLIISIYMISGIENTIRYTAMILIFIINIILVLLLRKLGKKEKKSNFIAFIILSLILAIIQLVVGYMIFRTYTSLANMNKDKITYTTAIVTKSDSKIENIEDLKDTTIGIVVDESSIDGYIIGLEIIEEEKLEDNNEIKEYTDISSLVKDLYSDDIDAMIISENYPSMFTSIDEYKNIETETKIIYTKSKTLSKDEIAKYTGEEMVNFNTSNKIDEPFTVLVMGIDSAVENLNKNATGNGDALMLVTFNPKTLNATILSIPRDTYVPISCFAGQKENKITHAAWNGESCMIKTIENFTGINIDYYVKINFQGVVKLVNALDGIEVDVPIEFCESNSHRSTKEENLICLEKGEQTLNGEQALALARHRKTLLTGDLQRGTNQQLVVQGILNKLKSIKNANQLLTILDTISNNMDTNFTTKQILSFYDIAKNLLLTSTSENLINMQQLYLSGSGQMIYDEGMGMVLYNYIPNEQSLNQIISIMKQNLGLEETDTIKKMTFSIKQTYQMETIGSNVTEATKTYTLLPNFVGESQGYATNWLANNGVSYIIQTQEVSSGYYDGQVISQSYPESKRIDLISGSITLTIAKVTQTVTPEEPIEEEDVVCEPGYHEENGECVSDQIGDPEEITCEEGYIKDENGNCILNEKIKE